VLWILDKELIYTFIHFFCKYIHNIHIPNTNRHVHAHKCAGIESATSCVVGEYYVQSTPHQTIHYELCTTLISMVLVLMYSVRCCWPYTQQHDRLALTVKYSESNLYFTMNRIKSKNNWRILTALFRQVCFMWNHEKF
jgi:hypothetical protein